MSKERISRYIPYAIDAVSKEFNGKPIPSTYNGYISAFGASIIQSGLLPTLAAYENESSNSKEDKTIISKLITDIICADESIGEKSLLKYAIKDKNDPITKEKIKDAAVALKLSLRTFKLEKEKGD